MPIRCHNCDDPIADADAEGLAIRPKDDDGTPRYECVPCREYEYNELDHMVRRLGKASVQDMLNQIEEGV
jgi:hypothetical protein